MLSVKSVTAIERIVLSSLIGLGSTLITIPLTATSPTGVSSCSIAVISSLKSLPYNTS